MWQKRIAKLYAVIYMIMPSVKSSIQKRAYHSLLRPCGNKQTKILVGYMLY